MNSVNNNPMVLMQNSTSRGSVAELELAKAKSAIEQFIYSCSHTMRGPLKSIAGLVYLLKNCSGAQTVDPSYYIQSIEDTVVKLETVLNELEQFLTNSSQDITTRSIDVGELINEVLKEFKGIIDEKKITIGITVEQLTPLYTDQNRLRIILTHILSNAVMYQDLRKDERKISIRMKISLSCCYVRITDNGIGIRDEIQDNIFHLFFRGSEKSVGSGVGLYIVREVLNKMGGIQSVKSRHEKGTCFSFSIPNLSA